MDRHHQQHPGIPEKCSNLCSAVSHLHCLHNMKVGDILVSKLGMLGQVDVFLGHHDTLFKEELVDSNAVLLGHKHLRKVRRRVLLPLCFKKHNKLVFASHIHINSRTFSHTLQFKTDARVLR